MIHKLLIDKITSIIILHYYKCQPFFVSLRACLSASQTFILNMLQSDIIFGEAT